MILIEFIVGQILSIFILLTVFVISPFVVIRFGKLKILDVGCGTGVNTIFFSENGCKAYGCDISKEALIGSRYSCKKIK